MNFLQQKERQLWASYWNSEITFIELLARLNMVYDMMKGIKK